MSLTNSLYRLARLSADVRAVKKGPGAVVPRDKDQRPKVCPKCKSAYWDTPRKKPEVEKRE